MLGMILFRVDIPGYAKKYSEIVVRHISNYEKNSEF